MISKLFSLLLTLYYLFWVIPRGVLEHSVSSIFIGGGLTPLMNMKQSVPKRRQIKFRRPVITQKKEYK